MSALTNILSHQVVYKLGWTLLHLLWQGAGVALILGILLRLLRRSTAALRYVVACLALASIIPALVVTLCLVPSAPPVSAGIESPSVTPLADTLLERQTTDMPLARAAEYMEIFTRTSWAQRVEHFFAPALPYIVAA